MDQNNYIAETEDGFWIVVVDGQPIGRYDRQQLAEAAFIEATQGKGGGSFQGAGGGTTFGNPLTGGKGGTTDPSSGNPRYISFDYGGYWVYFDGVKHGPWATQSEAEYALSKMGGPIGTTNGTQGAGAGAGSGTQGGGTPGGSTVASNQTYTTRSGQLTYDEIKRRLMEAGYAGDSGWDADTLVRKYNAIGGATPKPTVAGAPPGSGGGNNTPGSSDFDWAAFYKAISEGSEAERQEAIRQFNLTFGEGQYQFDRGQYTDLALALLSGAAQLRGPQDWLSYAQYTNGGRDIFQQLFGDQASPAFGAPTGYSKEANISDLLKSLGITGAPQRKTQGTGDDTGTGDTPIDLSDNEALDWLWSQQPQSFKDFYASNDWTMDTPEKQRNIIRNWINEADPDLKGLTPQQVAKRKGWKPTTTTTSTNANPDPNTAPGPLVNQVASSVAYEGAGTGGNAMAGLSPLMQTLLGETGTTTGSVRRLVPPTGVPPYKGGTGTATRTNPYGTITDPYDPRFYDPFTGAWTGPVPRPSLVGYQPPPPKITGYEGTSQSAPGPLADYGQSAPSPLVNTLLGLPGTHVTPVTGNVPSEPLRSNGQTYTFTEPAFTDYAPPSDPMAPLPHQIHPAVWNALSPTAKQMILAAASKGYTPSGAWNEEDYLAQMNAARPKGMAPQRTNFNWGAKAALF